MKIKAALSLLSGIFLAAWPWQGHADCSLTNLGLKPLCDLGPGMYLGHQGGLYPGGVNQRPAAHEAAGVAIATTQVLPRDAAGNVDTANGRVVLMSIGMSNTTQYTHEL